MSRPQRPTPNRQLLQDTNANASSPTGWQWARIPFTRASSSLSLSPLAKGAQTPSANTPGEDKEDPFATPAPSQAPSSVPSQKNTPQASRVQTPEVSKDSTVQQSSSHTAPVSRPTPTITVSRAPSICSGSSSNSSGSSRGLPSNEKIARQFPESLRIQPQRKDRLTRLPLPPSQPSLTPSQKWTRGRGFWRSFIAICIPLLLSALEGSVTNTALPTISDALNLGTAFSWVATAFLLASTIFQPLYGQLADIWGRKNPMMLATLVFGAGSAVCGWAQSGAVLIFGRIIQGLGTGGIDLFAELILSDLVPLRQRGTYMSIKHCVFAAGTTMGPLLGGVFAEHGWRWCFWINLPVCALSIVLMWFWLHVGGGIKTKDVKMVEELRKIDGLGTSILTTAVVLVLVALSTGGAHYPWSHATTVVPFVFGLLLLIVFPFWERSKRCKYPIMPPSIFANRTSATAFALTSIHGFLTYGIQFYLPPFFQAVKGSSPTKSGIEVLPTTLVIVVMAALGGPLLSKFGKYKPIHHLGFASMTLGFGLCITMTQDTPAGGWVVFQLILAFGSGIVVSTMLPAVLVELPDKANGSAAGSWAFLRGTGSLFGVAIPGAIFNVRFAQLLPSIHNSKAQTQLAKGQAYQRASSAFVSRFGSDVKCEIVRAFTESLKCVWIVFAAMAGVGFVLTFLERQVKMRKELDTKYGLKTPKASGMNTPRSGECTPPWDRDPEMVKLEV